MRKGLGLSRRAFVAGTGLAIVTSGLILERSATARQDGPAASATRRVEHALGVTEVPAVPQRVVAFFNAVDVALAVGVTPVGVDHASTLKRYLAGRLPGVTPVGDDPSPNIETIATLRPDLILGSDLEFAEMYESLSRIAPTVAITFNSSGEWKRHGQEYAAALGRAGEYAQVMGAYAAKVDRIRAALGVGLPEGPVAILRATPDHLRFDLPGIFNGSVVYGDAGLSLPPSLAAYSAANPDENFVMISREQFDMAEGATALFVWSVGGDPEEDRRVIEAALADPLLGRLDAVRQGRVYPVGDHWFAASVLGADLILDDLERHLLGAGTATPADGR
jgi:iron complex transport system substrate-binding protein